MSRKSLFILSVLAAASFNAAACYTVFDRSNRVAYQGNLPPVDMSLPLHRGLQSRFPGGHMVFDQSAACAPIVMQQVSRAPVASVPPDTSVMGAGPANGKAVRSTHRAAAPSTSPLITDARTAESMHLPYRSLGGNIVVVPAQAAAQVRLPNMTVVPATPVASARTNGETVITEMHNPPMTVVQAGNDTIVSRY